MFTYLRNKKTYLLVSLMLVYVGVILVFLPNFLYIRYDAYYLQFFGFMSSAAGLLTFFNGQTNLKIDKIVKQMAGLEDVGIERVLELSPKSIADISIGFAKSCELKSIVQTPGQLRFVRSIVEQLAGNNYQSSSKMYLIVNVNSCQVSAINSIEEQMYLYEIKSFIKYCENFKHIDINIRKTSAASQSFIMAEDSLLVISTLDPLKQISIGIVLNPRSRIGTNNERYFHELWLESPQIDDKIFEA